MPNLSDLLFRKTKRERNFAWRVVCNTWYDIRSVSTWESPDWNPWRQWCTSWQEFVSSEKKPPIAERAKADMFSQLFHIAKLTGDKLEEAKVVRTDLDRRTIENITLRNQNVVLQQKCEELQRQLDEEKRMMIINQQLNEKNLEREVKHKTELQDQNNDLMLMVQEKNEELQKVQAECQNLKNKCSSFEDQLKELNKKNSSQNGKEERTLDPDSIRDIADRLGEVTRHNVFDWLCRFEVQYQNGNWTKKDMEEILCRCMDSFRFSLLPLSMTGTIRWVFTLKQIAERFFPNLNDQLATETMRDDETALQYFHRMWMIYRIVNFPSVSTKNDKDYIKVTVQGLPQHLYDAIEDFEDYEDIEHDVLLAESSWAIQENQKILWHMKRRKAGAGCPPRYKIWKRLEKYLDSVPYEEINEAPYWDLLVMLSRHEDLETGEPVNYKIPQRDFLIDMDSSSVYRYPIHRKSSKS